MTGESSEGKQVTQPVTVTTGPERIADAKIRLGKWLENQREDDTPAHTLGFATVADLKIKLGEWIESRRNHDR